MKRKLLPPATAAKLDQLQTARRLRRKSQLRRRAATLRNITATDATQSGRAPRETARVLQLDEKTPEAVAMKAHGEEQRAGASSFYPAVLVLATSSAPCSPDSESPLAFPARGNTVRAITIRL